MTVVLEFIDGGEPTGEVTYFGTSCAAKALADRGVRVTAARVRDAAQAAQRQRVATAERCAETLAFYGIAVDEPVDEALIERVLPRWRDINRSLDGLRPMDEARRLFVDSVQRNQAAVLAVA